MYHISLNAWVQVFTYLRSWPNGLAVDGLHHGHCQRVPQAPGHEPTEVLHDVDGRLAVAPRVGAQGGVAVSGLTVLVAVACIGVSWNMIISL